MHQLTTVLSSIRVSSLSLWWRLKSSWASQEDLCLG